MTILNDEDIQIVVTDYDMPFMNGIELYKRIKKIDRYKDLKVIFFTGNEAGFVQEEAIALGTEEYIVVDKHDKLNTLIDRIYKIIN